jgi:hypothetical protein
MRRLALRDEREDEREESLARLALLKGALTEIESLRRAGQFPSDLLETTARRYERRLQNVQNSSEQLDSSATSARNVHVKRLAQLLFTVEREQLETLRLNAAIHDSVFFDLSRNWTLKKNGFVGRG